MPINSNINRSYSSSVENLKPGTIESGEGITDPQQFIISSIALILDNSTSFELKPSLLELSIYEDLFSPASSGYVMVTDSVGFIEKFNITGFNFIEVSFNKVGIDDKQKYVRIFRVYKIGERIQSSRSNETYAIYFCSEELFLSEQTKIAKAFPNKTIDEVVMSILSNTLKTPSKKIGNIEKTKGYTSFIVPNLKPFEAINWLSTYAQPSETEFKGADMLFFENRDGYNFRSIQSMITDTVYNSYNYSPQNLDRTSEDINFNFSAILSYKFFDTFDSLKMINSGGYANQVLHIDPLLRTSEVTKFNYDNYFQQAGTLNKYPISSQAPNRLGKKVADTSEAVYKVAVSNSQQRNFPSITQTNTGLASTSPSIDIEVYIPNRTAQLAIINYSKVEVLVPGDPSLSVGRVVRLNLPSLSDDKNPKENSLDKYNSGNYLVSAVRHKMDVRGVYQCLFEAIKDTISSQNGAYDNSVLGKSIREQ